MIIFFLYFHNSKSKNKSDYIEYETNQDSQEETDLKDDLTNEYDTELDDTEMEDTESIEDSNISKNNKKNKKKSKRTYGF